jgi:hypothetical protein
MFFQFAKHVTVQGSKSGRYGGWGTRSHLQVSAGDSDGVSSRPPGVVMPRLAPSDVHMFGRLKKTFLMPAFSI